MTATEFNTLRAWIQEEIQKFTGPGGDIIQGTFIRLGKLASPNESCGMYELLFIPISAFHDCVSPSCDGCLNMANEDNAGLQRAIDSLEIVKGKAVDEGIEVTRADLWALAGKRKF